MIRLAVFTTTLVLLLAFDSAYARPLWYLAPEFQGGNLRTYDSFAEINLTAYATLRGFKLGGGIGVTSFGDELFERRDDSLEVWEVTSVQGFVLTGYDWRFLGLSYRLGWGSVAQRSTYSSDFPERTYQSCDLLTHDIQTQVYFLRDRYMSLYVSGGYRHMYLFADYVRAKHTTGFYGGLGVNAYIESWHSYRPYPIDPFFGADAAYFLAQLILSMAAK